MKDFEQDFDKLEHRHCRDVFGAAGGRGSIVGKPPGDGLLQSRAGCKCQGDGIFIDEEGQPSNPIFATQSNWLVHQLGALESSSTSDLCYPSVDATSEASGPRVRPVADAAATADDGNQREALRRSRKLHV